MNFEKYKDLELFLKDWCNFSGEGAYDSVGLLYLFKAILSNLSENHVEGDFEVLKDIFSNNDKELVYLESMLDSFKIKRKNI